MKLVVGLGNPGKQYELTRHNVGFRVLDSLNLEFQNGFSGLYAKTENCVYLKPQTFMNVSGSSVLEALQFYKLEPAGILIIHDELDLPFGTVRLKKGGGHAGHNGLRDIIRLIGPDFSRIRIGIGKPALKSQIHAYVLSPFLAEEETKLPHIIEQACQLIES